MRHRPADVIPTVVLYDDTFHTDIFFVTFADARSSAKTAACRIRGNIRRTNAASGFDMHLDQ